MNAIIDAIKKEIEDTEQQQGCRGGMSAQRGALLLVKTERLQALLKDAEFIRQLAP